MVRPHECRILAGDTEGVRRALVELEGMHLFSRKRERGDLAAQMAEIARQLSAKRFGALFALHRTMEGTEPGHGGFIADWISMLDEASAAVRARHDDLHSNGARRDMEFSAVKEL